MWCVYMYIDPSGVTMYVCGEMPTVLDTTEMRNGYLYIRVWWKTVQYLVKHSHWWCISSAHDTQVYLLITTEVRQRAT